MTVFICDFLIIAVQPLVPSSKHWEAHHFLAWTGFSLSFLLSFILAYYIGLQNQVFSLLVIGVTIFAFLFYLAIYVKDKTCYAFQEYIYFLSMLVWNIFVYLPVSKIFCKINFPFCF